MIKRVSTDHGATWSQPRIVHEYPAEVASLETFEGQPRLWPHMDIKTLKNGSLVMSTDVGGTNEGGSALFISSDNGESWSEQTRFGWQAESFGQPNRTAGWIAGIHAPVVELPDGTLMAIGRANNIDGRAPLSLSSDQGKTWSYHASPFPPIYSSQRAILMRLNHGPLLFIGYTDLVSSYQTKTVTGMDFVDAAGDTRRGDGMFSKLSFDEGKTWTHAKLIPHNIARPWESLYYGYLPCIQSPDDTIHLLSSSRYYRFNLAWLKEPMPE